MRYPRILLVFFVFLTSLYAADRPNVLLVFTDDQGINDVGCYGSEIPTPNIDRLAGQGMLFECWYSASSICTPSRFGLLTGRNPSRSNHQLLSALMFMADEHKTTGILLGSAS
jgi:arylsulfatase A